MSNKEFRDSHCFDKGARFRQNRISPFTTRSFIVSPAERGLACIFKLTNALFEINDVL